MRDESLENILTTAARRALDAIVEEYREQLLLGARESAARLGGLREISVHDIVAGVLRQQSRLAGPFPTSIERLISLYVWTGLLIGLGGLCLFTFREIIKGRSPEEQLPLIVALGGFCVAGLGYFTLRARKSRALRLALHRPTLESAAPDYVASVASQWRDLELALRGVVSERLGESAAAAPLSLLLDMLKKEGVMADSDSNRLRELLALRNNVLHGRLELTQEQLEAATRDGDRLLRRLRGASHAA